MALTHLLKNRSYLLLTVITLVSCIFFFAIITPFLLTITLAGIFVVGLAPLVEKIRVKYGMARQRIFFGIVLFGIFAFFSLASVCIFRLYDLTLGEDNSKTVELLNSVRTALNSASGTMEDVARSVLSNLGIKSSPRIGEQTELLLKKVSSLTFSLAGKFFAGLPFFTIHFIVFLITLYVFYKYRNRVRSLIIKYKFASEAEVDTVTELLQNSGGSMLSSNMIVGIVQASVVTIGAAIVGLNEWSIIFTLTFICSFIPIIGAAPIGFLLSIFCFLTHQKGAGIFMVIIAVISGTIDNVIRPYLVARADENLNPLVTLVGIVGAISLFGFHGIFIGPFVMSVAASALPKLLEATNSTQG